MCLLVAEKEVKLFFSGKVGIVRRDERKLCATNGVCANKSNCVSSFTRSFSFFCDAILVFSTSLQEMAFVLKLGMSELFDFPYVSLGFE